jgi:hypothetical protein
MSLCERSEFGDIFILIPACAGTTEGALDTGIRWHDKTWIPAGVYPEFVEGREQQQRFFVWLRMTKNVG